MRKSFDFLLLVSVPIGLGIVIVADPLVVLLFGQSFAQSGPILAVMGIVLIFMYQNILVGQFLISMDRQNIWTVVMIIATVITIPLDLLLVPWCQQSFGNGAIGGAISFVFCEAGMVMAGIVLLPKGSLSWSNVSVAARVIVAGLVMTVVTWQWRDMFIVIPIVIGALTYLGSILLLRVVSSEDRALLQQVMQGIFSRLRRRDSGSISTTGA
jgi:O-antigen/teichoic acid export membrane protein